MDNNCQVGQSRSMVRGTIKEEAAAEDIRTMSRKSITGHQDSRKDIEGILGTVQSLPSWVQRFKTVTTFRDFDLSRVSVPPRHSCRAFTLKVTQCHQPVPQAAPHSAHGSSKP